MFFSIQRTGTISYKCSLSSAEVRITFSSSWQGTTTAWKQKPRFQSDLYKAVVSFSGVKVFWLFVFVFVVEYGEGLQIKDGVGGQL